VQEFLTEGVVIILSRLLFGAIAAFLAIVLWSKTRDSAWMFVVIATIVAYGDVVYATLETLGLVEAELLVVAEVSLFRVILANLPTIFYAIAFAIMVFRRYP
jgi:hypothetical protein